MCVCVGVCVFCLCVLLCDTHDSKQSFTIFPQLLLLPVCIFFCSSFSLALKRQSMLGLKIDSLSNVNDDDISRIVFAKLYTIHV